MKTSRNGPDFQVPQRSVIVGVSYGLTRRYAIRLQAISRRGEKSCPFEAPAYPVMWRRLPHCERSHFCPLSQRAKARASLKRLNDFPAHIPDAGQSHLPHV